MSDPTSDELLRELGKQLAYDRPDDERRETMRAALMQRARDEASAPPVHRWRFVAGGFAAGLAAAAVAVLVVGVRGGGHADDHAPIARGVVVERDAVIESSSAAELEHTVAVDGAGQQEEVVRLRAGHVRLAVAPATARKHVVLRTGDATVEGVGAYEVTVAHDALATVTVTTGHATIVRGNERAIFLAEGQTWSAPVITADVTPPAPTPQPPPVPVPVPAAVAAPIVAHPHAPALPPAPPPTPAPTPEPALSTPTPPPIPTPTPTPAPIVPPQTEAAFQAGWAALRAGKYADAARQLGDAADRDDGPLAADARYFQAIALVKAGRKTEAERAYVQFLDRAPKSLRRGRAAVALARLIEERGDRASAHRWFATAVDDADAGIAAAARAGLHATE